MSEMKMSDVFDGRVVLDSSCGKVGGGCLEIGDDLGWIAHFGVHNDRDVNESNEVAIHAIYAINNHDRMVEEIAELREALCDVIDGCSECDLNYQTGLSIARCQEIMDISSKLNQEGEERYGSSFC